MDLKQKLQQLGPASPAGWSPTQEPAPTLVESAEALANLGRDAVCNDCQHMLAQLREQMQALMQRKPGLRQQLPPGPPPLDFAPWETSRGIVHRRTRRWSSEHWIGCIPVKAAASASTEFWALLGLDPNLAECVPTRVLFLDTETTGLGAGAGIVPFLVGLAWFGDDGQVVLEQLLLRSPAEEPAQLQVLTERIDAASAVVTFNGKSFDWPLLVSRFLMNRLEAPRIQRHFDLLHVARRLHKPRMGRVNLRALELDVLGLERGPDIDGAEIGPRYNHFLRTGDEDALRPVIEHNATDVLSMVALVGLYGEPVERLATADLVPLGRVFRRARDSDKASSVAERAVQLGGGPEARRLRAELAKARGDRDGALADFEALCQTLDDPSARLELAKLYEHHVKTPQRALEIVEQGTGESSEDAARRKQRLKRKLQLPALR